MIHKFCISEVSFLNVAPGKVLWFWCFASNYIGFSDFADDLWHCQWCR